MSRIKSIFNAVRGLAKIAVPVLLFISALDFIGVSTAQFVYYSLAGLTYFGLCSALWIAVYINDTDESSLAYYIVIFLSLPFVGLVKIAGALNLFDFIERKINSQAQKMGLPNADALIEHIETQAETSRE